MEKDRIFKGNVKQKGIYNFKDLYEFLYDYLLDQNFDIFETKYTEKVEGESKNLEIVWTATREISDYFRIEIRLHWFVFGMKKIKVKKEGKEITMDSGTIEIKMEGYLQKDFENRWENHPFWKFLRGLYDRYIIKSRVNDHEIKVFEETNEVATQAKSFLAVEGRKG